MKIWNIMCMKSAFWGYQTSLTELIIVTYYVTEY
jgi:hypothetical protein